MVRPVQKGRWWMTESLAESSSRLVAQTSAASSSSPNRSGSTMGCSLAPTRIKIRCADHMRSISPYRKNLCEDGCEVFPGLSSPAAVNIASCRDCGPYVGLPNWRHHEIEDQPAHLQVQVPRPYVKGKRRVSIYWTWSYPWESQRDLT